MIDPFYGLVKLWHWIPQLDHDANRHLELTRSATTQNRPITLYTSDDLRRIRRTQQKERLSPETWKLIGELGIRKRYRSKRWGTHNRRTLTPSCPDSGSDNNVERVVLDSCISNELKWFPDIILANVRSLKPKKDELQVVADLNNAGVVCITETWLGPSIPDESVSLGAFCLFRRDRLSSSGSGGVAVYVSLRTSCHSISEYEIPEVESLWLTIRPYRLPRSVSIIHTTGNYLPSAEQRLGR